ncbi:hypothetical protein IJF81_07475 [bacterium]|nr:hypothetical protein [bacterium]
MDKVSFQGRSLIHINPKVYIEQASIINPATSKFKNYAKIIPGVSKTFNCQEGDFFVFTHNGNESYIERFPYAINMEGESFAENLLDHFNKITLNAKEKVTCMIFGGLPNDTKTINMINKLADAYEGHDISIFAGLKDTPIGKFIVKNSMATGKPEVFIPPTKTSPIRNLDSLEDSFDIFELSNAELVN